MILYSGPLSLFTAKVRIALAEKNLDYERVEVPFTAADGYQPKHPEVLAHNPKSQVPVLVDGDLVLWDSTVIVEYLDEVAPEPRLLPKGPRARARCRMLELHADEVFFPNVLTLIREVFYGDGSASDTIEAARSGITGQHAELDRLLATGASEWIGGEVMTAADVATRLVSFFASGLGAAPSPDLGALHAWIRRMDARAAVQQEIREMTQALASLRTA